MTFQDERNMGMTKIFDLDNFLSYDQDESSSSSSSSSSEHWAKGGINKITYFD